MRRHSIEQRPVVFLSWIHDCSSVSLVYSILVVLLSMDAVCCQNEGHDHKLERPEIRSSRITALSPLLMSVPASYQDTTPAAPTNDGFRAVRGQYINRLLGQIRVGRRSETGEGTSPPPRSNSSVSTETRASLNTSAFTPSAPNIEHIPKSQLALRTGDLDYTRFRQLFLRQLCQRLLNGSNSSQFRFCFSILAL